jgi:hypothetical protein
VARFTVKRSGEFKCKLAPENQCGTKGTGKFAYRFEAGGGKLNGDNILVEHHAIHDLIVKTFGEGKWKGSCEQIASNIIQLVKDTSPNVTHVTVELKPGEIASIEVEWDAYSSSNILPTPAVRVDAKAVAAAKKDGDSNYVRSSSQSSC